LIALLVWLWKILRELGLFAGLAQLLWDLINWLRELLDRLPDPRKTIPPEPTDPPPEEPDDGDDPEDEPAIDCMVAWANIPLMLSVEPQVVKVPWAANMYEVTMPFRMFAGFEGSHGPRCECCQYRQFVAGEFREQLPGGSWRVIPHRTRRPTRTLLTRTSWADDGYGYRALPADQNDKYLPAQPDGCVYTGRDDPGHTVPLNSRVDIVLHFVGVVLELPPMSMANQGPEEFNARWTIHIRGTVVEDDQRWMPWWNIWDDLLRRRRTVYRLDPL